jgi:hypothetical protein
MGDAQQPDRPRSEIGGTMATESDTAARAEHETAETRTNLPVRPAPTAELRVEHEPTLLERFLDNLRAALSAPTI